MASNTEIKPITDERRTYKRDWMRRARAKRREELQQSGSGDPVTTTQPADPHVHERIQSLEQELAVLRAEVAPVGLTLNLDPDAIELRKERIAAFEADLSGMHACRSIATLRAKVAAARAEFEALRQGGEWPQMVNDRNHLLKHSDRVHELETRERQLEDLIALWSPGGGLRREREQLLADDRAKGIRQTHNEDPHIRRLGIVLLKACDKNEGELMLTVGRLEAELKQLRG